MSKLIEQFHLPFISDVLPPRFNIAPSQTVVAIRQAADSHEREIAWLKWGLVPAWAEDPAIGNRMINARAETAASKQAFRSAFRQRRCLVPVDGFYEWQKIGRQRQPHHITLRDGGLFAIAGLWERWQGEGETLESCTLLTTEANATLEPLHDRMPVIVPAAAYAKWLDPLLEDLAELQALLTPYPAEEMTRRPVDPIVNGTTYDDPRCLAPLRQKSLF